MKESIYKNYNNLPLFLNAKWGPSGNVKHFRWERRNSGMTKPSPIGGGEGYGACDNEVAKVLGIAPSRAYDLMHEKGFPVLKVGNRMVVPKEQFIRWVNQNTGGGDGL